MEQIYDILIIGGGVAGMTASVYAKRRNKNVAIIERLTAGGQVLSLEKIENFPSQSQIDGLSLVKMFKEQLKNLDIPILRDNVEKVELLSDVKTLFGQKGVYRAKKVIVASGVESVRLGLDGENLSGVSYCAVCDGAFFKGKNVFVASKNGSGVKDALYLCQIAQKVTLLDSADMSVFAGKNDKLEVISNCHIREILGEDKFEGVKLENSTLSGDALFVELGKRPSTQIFDGILKLDGSGFILTDEHMQTNVDGVFAIGDVRAGTLKQIVTACSDGAIAGNFA